MERKNTPKYRRVGQNVLDVATNFNGRSNVTDSQSGFRAFAGHIVPLFRFAQKGYGIESEMLIEASKAGLRIKEVEIGVRYDVAGFKLNPVSHGVGVLFKVLKDMEFNRPLYYFTFPGVLMIATRFNIRFDILRRISQQHNSIPCTNNTCSTFNISRNFYLFYRGNITLHE